ncbi:DEAD/DEAH box helicase [Flavobacterium sp. HSC-61S13]|uniref:DEAD/DEAH box helicase n=1 Tax=Flavobacterium sp. HSC-61S13 TaxID=2910963 RepID=UPI00209F5197|nr:DEAD/DEAH box helicase [Flavobacterium sp. HSC-61S13]MCP1997058.1 ATP-dependent RNA helicase RhlE [Flavobacterium sp. HSC-61S13]
MSFQSLGLSSHLSKAINNLGLLKPFEIQSQTIPLILKGKDVMGIAKTGSGKTLCFVAPLLQKIQHQDYEKSRNIKVLVLVPTRELAVQIEKTYSDLQSALRRPVPCMAVYGGVSINPQMKKVYGTEILIATPGRLLDLIDQKALSIENLEYLIIDEADKMFQLGFEEEMNRILDMVPAKKQTIMFSATLNDKVQQIKKTLAITPEIIEVKEEALELESIEQVAYRVASESKGPFLRYLIKEQHISPVLVFVSSTRTAENLVEKLKKNGINALAVHGKKSQGARMDNLADFKVGDADVLIATDLIGRGIHIEGLPYVINYELPRSPLDYVHRIGRTGRAHEHGKAISLITADDEHHFKIIQKKMGRQVEILETDTIDLKGL